MKPTITTRPQTTEEAFRYAKNCFLRRQLYQNRRVDFPNHPAFIEVWEQNKDIDQEKESELWEIFKNEIYPKLDLTSAVNKIQKSNEVVLLALNITNVWKETWDFNLLENYTVVLTPYGPGGSYDLSGMIVLKINHPRPYAETIIHEAVHIGVEFLVKKYALDQSEKERLVDLICQAAFSDLLPNYFFQKMGDPALDKFIDKEALKNLPLVLEKYKSETR
jgi:hypothetical protein